jgi:hypothetical protein
MNYIPLQPLASQQFTTTLAGQTCLIALYQKSSGLYMDLTVNNVSILNAQICLVNTLLVRFSYLGFVGDLAFIDTQANGAPLDPYFTGLGDSTARWQFLYLTPTDVAVQTVAI